MNSSNLERKVSGYRNNRLEHPDQGDSSSCLVDTEDKFVNYLAETAVAYEQGIAARACEKFPRTGEVFDAMTDDYFLPLFNQLWDGMYSVDHMPIARDVFEFLWHYFDGVGFLSDGCPDLSDIIVTKCPISSEHAGIYVTAFWIVFELSFVYAYNGVIFDFWANWRLVCDLLCLLAVERGYGFSVASRSVESAFQLCEDDDETAPIFSPVPNTGQIADFMKGHLEYYGWNILVDLVVVSSYDFPEVGCLPMSVFGKWVTYSTLLSCSNIKKVFRHDTWARRLIAHDTGKSVVPTFSLNGNMKAGMILEHGVLEASCECRSTNKQCVCKERLESLKPTKKFTRLRRPHVLTISLLTALCLLPTAQAKVVDHGQIRSIAAMACTAVCALLMILYWLVLEVGPPRVWRFFKRVLKRRFTSEKVPPEEFFDCEMGDKFKEVFLACTMAAADVARESPEADFCPPEAPQADYDEVDDFQDSYCDSYHKSAWSPDRAWEDMSIFPTSHVEQTARQCLHRKSTFKPISVTLDEEDLDACDASVVAEAVATPVSSSDTFCDRHLFWVYFGAVVTCVLFSFFVPPAIYVCVPIWLCSEFHVTKNGFLSYIFYFLKLTLFAIAVFVNVFVSFYWSLLFIPIVAFCYKASLLGIYYKCSLRIVAEVLKYYYWILIALVFLAKPALGLGMAFVKIKWFSRHTGPPELGGLSEIVVKVCKFDDSLVDDISEATVDECQKPAEFFKEASSAMVKDVRQLGYSLAQTARLCISEGITEALGLETPSASFGIPRWMSEDSSTRLTLAGCAGVTGLIMLISLAGKKRNYYKWAGICAGTLAACFHNEWLSSSFLESAKIFAFSTESGALWDCLSNQEEPQADTLKEPSFFAFLDSINDKTKIAQETTLSTHARNFLAHFVVQGAVRKDDDKMRVTELLELAVGKIGEKVSLQKLLESAVYFVKLGTLTFQCCDPVRAYKALELDTDSDFEKCRKLDFALANNRNVLAKGVQINQMIATYANCRNKISLSLKGMRKGSLKAKAAVLHISELDDFILRAVRYLHQNRLKVFPFGWTIWGDAGIGKTTVQKNLALFGHAMLGLKIMITGTKTEGEARDENLYNDTTWVDFNDLSNYVEKYKKDAIFKTVLRLHDKNPCHLEKADLESKKNQFLNAPLIGYNGHDPWMGMKGESRDLGSVARRLGLILHMTIDDDVSGPNGELDRVKAREIYGDLNPMEIPPWVRMQVCMPVINPDNREEGDMLINKQLLRGNDIYRLYGMKLSRHFNSETQMPRPPTVEDALPCPHLCPRSTCDKCPKNEEPEPEFADGFKSCEIFREYFANEKWIPDFSNVAPLNDATPGDMFEFTPEEPHASLCDSGEYILQGPDWTYAECSGALVVNYFKRRGCDEIMQLIGGNSVFLFLGFLFVWIWTSPMVSSVEHFAQGFATLVAIVWSYAWYRSRPYHKFMVMSCEELSRQCFNYTMLASSKAIFGGVLVWTSAKVTTLILRYIYSLILPTVPNGACEEPPVVEKITPTAWKAGLEEDKPSWANPVMNLKYDHLQRKGTSVEQLANKIAENVVEIWVKSLDQPGAKAFRMFAVFLKPITCYFPKHLLLSNTPHAVFSSKYEITLRHQSTNPNKASKGTRTFVKRLEEIVLHDQDLACFDYPGFQKFSDLTKHLADGEVEANTVVRRLTWKKGGGFHLSDALLVEHAAAEYQQGDYAFTQPIYRTHPTEATEVGSCGSILISTYGDKSSCIAGMHVSGTSRSHILGFRGRVRASAQPLSMSMVNEMHEALTSSTSSLRITDRSKIRTDYADYKLEESAKLRDKHPINFMDPSCAVEVKGLFKSDNTQRSTTQPNPFLAEAEACFGVSIDFQTADMNWVKSYRKSLHLGMCPSPVEIDTVLLDFVTTKFGEFYVDPYIDEFLEHMRDVAPNLPLDQPLTLEQARDGIPGVLNPIDKTTSGQYPPGPKSKQLDENGNFTSEAERVINEIVSDYMRDEHPGTFAKCNLKDEALPAEKSSNQARCVFTMHLADLLAAKMCFGLANHFMVHNATKVGVALGIDYGAPEWHELLRDIASTGENDVSSTDYSAYDSTQPLHLKIAATKVLLNILRKLGWNESYIRRAESVAQQWLGGNILYKDVLVELDKIFPSGNFLTALLNSIMSKLIKMYSYYKTCGVDAKPFNEVISSAELGDDDIFRNSSDKWTNDDLVTDTTNFGMIVTSDDKAGKPRSRPFCESGFLKCSTWYREDLGHAVGARKPSSVLRSHYYITGLSGDIREHQRMVMMGAIDDVALNGKAAYEKWRKCAIAYSAAIDSPTEWLFAMDWEAAMERLRNKNPLGKKYPCEKGMKTEPPNPEWLQLHVDPAKLLNLSPTVRARVAKYLRIFEGAETPEMDDSVETSVEVHGTLTTTTANQVETSGVSSVQPTVSTGTGMEDQLLATEVKVLAGTLTAGGYTFPQNAETYCFSINPWRIWMSRPAIRKRISGMSYFCCDMQVRITFSSSPGDYGMALASVNLGAGLRADPPESYPQNGTLAKHSISCSRSHAISNVEMQEEIVLTVPFVSPMVALPWDDEFLLTLPLVDLELLCPIRNAYDRTPKVRVAVFVKPLNFKMQSTFYPKGGDKEYNVYDPFETPEVDTHPDEPPSSTLTAVGGTLGAISRVDPSGTLRVASEVISGAGEVARSLGWSRPIDRSVGSVIPELIHSMANSDLNITSGRTLSVMSSQEVAISPDAAGATSPEMLDVAAVSSRWSLIGRKAWSSNDSVGKVLWRLAITPAIFLDSGNVRVPASCAIPAMFFHCWNAEMQYKVVISAASVHGGQLSAYVSPTTRKPEMDEQTQVLGTETLPYLLVDIRNVREFRVNVEWAHTMPAALTHIGAFTSVFGDENNDVLHPRVCNNGTITFRVESPLCGPSDTPTAEVLLYARCKEDAFFYRPDYTGISDYRLPQVTKLAQPPSPVLSNFLSGDLLPYPCCGEVPMASEDSETSAPATSAPASSVPQTNAPTSRWVLTREPVTSNPTIALPEPWVDPHGIFESQQAMEDCAKNCDCASEECIHRQRLCNSIAELGCEDPVARSFNETEAPSSWSSWLFKSSAPSHLPQAPTTAPEVNEGNNVTTGPEGTETTAPSGVASPPGTSEPQPPLESISPFANVTQAPSLEPAFPSQGGNTSLPPIDEADTGAPSTAPAIHTLPPLTAPPTNETSAETGLPTPGQSDVVGSTAAPSTSPSQAGCEGLCNWLPGWVLSTQADDRVGYRRSGPLAAGSYNDYKVFVGQSWNLDETYLCYSNTPGSYELEAPFYGTKGFETLEIIGAFEGLSNLTLSLKAPAGSILTQSYVFIDHDTGTGLGSLIFEITYVPSTGFGSIVVGFDTSGPWKIEEIKVPYPSDATLMWCPAWAHISPQWTYNDGTPGNYSVPDGRTTGYLELKTTVGVALPAFPISACGTYTLVRYTGALSQGASTYVIDSTVFPTMSTAKMPAIGKITTGYGNGKGWLLELMMFVLKGHEVPNSAEDEAPVVMMQVGNAFDRSNLARAQAGETIANFRSLLKIPVPINKHTGSGGSSWQVTGDIHYVGDLALYITPLSFFSSCYLGIRGGMVKTFHILGEGILHIARSSLTTAEKAFMSALAGCEVFDSRINPMATVRLPYQTSVRFVVLNGKYRLFPAEHQYTLMMEPRGNGNAVVREYAAISEDTTFVHWVEVPYMVRQAS